MNKLILFILTGHMIFGSSVFAMEPFSEIEDAAVTTCSYKDLEKKMNEATETFNISFNNWQEEREKIFASALAVPSPLPEIAKEKFNEHKIIIKHFIDIIEEVEQAYKKNLAELNKK